MTPRHRGATLPEELVKEALEIAIDLLGEAPNYDHETRLVPSETILLLVQKLNTAASLMADDA